MMFEVELTSPQIELEDGSLVMFWYPAIEINAQSQSQAKKKVKKMIKNNEIDYDILDEDGSPRDFDLEEIDNEVPDPEIDYVVKL
jgi:hypothetical protein